MDTAGSIEQLFCETRLFEQISDCVHSQSWDLEKEDPINKVIEFKLTDGADSYAMSLRLICPQNIVLVRCAMPMDVSPERRFLLTRLLSIVNFQNFGCGRFVMDKETGNVYATSFCLIPDRNVDAETLMLVINQVKNLVKDYKDNFEEYVNDSANMGLLQQMTLTEWAARLKDKLREAAGEMADDGKDEEEDDE